MRVEPRIVVAASLIAIVAIAGGVVLFNPKPGAPELLSFMGMCATLATTLAGSLVASLTGSRRANRRRSKTPSSDKGGTKP